MWWLFSNKKRGKVYSYDFNLHSKLKTMEENLKNSFFNIKKDIIRINYFLYHHDNNIAHLKERILFLEARLRELNHREIPEKIVKENQKNEDLVYEEEKPSENLDKKPTLLVK